MYDRKLKFRVTGRMQEEGILAYLIAHKRYICIYDEKILLNDTL